MLVAGFPAGSFQTNCYVVARGAGEACVVVDPGQDAVDELDALLAQHRLTPVAVLLTHGHLDHTYSVAPVCDGHDVPAFIHPEDRAMLADPLRGLSREAAAFFGGLQMREPKEVRPLHDGAVLELAGLTLTVDHTPGHTRGSVVFTAPADDGTDVIFAGDTLFAGSIGRTDLPGGDHAQMLASLRDKFLTRDDGALVLPGHGPTTTVGRERASNPFLQDLPDPSGAPTRGPGSVTAARSDSGARIDAVRSDSGARIDAVEQRVQPFAAPKGVPDYVPPGSAAFEHVRDTLIAAADRAGYGLVELPVFEDTGLYARGVGESTDVVSKEMYTFADRGDRSVTLRPEGTAGVVRSVIEHGLDRAGLPVKLRYAGPFFRYERPQAGRYRQLQQVGIEAIGVDDPALDAEVIAVAAEGFRALGLTGHRLELTSLGDAECRPAYRELLQEYLAGLPLDEATRERARINPLRVLDDKRPEVRALLADAPLLVDHLSPASAEHHAAVLTHLDDLGVAYVANPRMVRGLDYYTKTTFEFVHDGLGAQSGIGGGGRYDGLMATLGGQPLSGVGYGIGVDRTLLACRAEGLTPWSEARVEVFGVPLGEPARRRLMVLAAQLRRAGVRVDLAYGTRGLKGAMKSADRSGARFALVLGERDLDAGTVGVKDMVSGEQESVALDAVLDDLVARLR